MTMKLQGIEERRERGKKTLSSNNENRFIDLDNFLSFSFSSLYSPVEMRALIRSFALQHSKSLTFHAKVSISLFDSSEQVVGDKQQQQHDLNCNEWTQRKYLRRCPRALLLLNPLLMMMMMLLHFAFILSHFYFSSASTCSHLHQSEFNKTLRLYKILYLSQYFRLDLT